MLINVCFLSNSQLLRNDRLLAYIGCSPIDSLNDRLLGNREQLLHRHNCRFFRQDTGIAQSEVYRKSLKIVSCSKGQQAFFQIGYRRSVENVPSPEAPSKSSSYRRILYVFCGEIDSKIKMFTERCLLVDVFWRTFSLLKVAIYITYEFTWTEKRDWRKPLRWIKSCDSIK